MAEKLKPAPGRYLIVSFCSRDYAVTAAQLGKLMTVLETLHEVERSQGYDFVPAGTRASDHVYVRPGIVAAPTATRLLAITDQRGAP